MKCLINNPPGSQNRSLKFYYDPYPHFKEEIEVVIEETEPQNLVFCYQSLWSRWCITLLSFLVSERVPEAVPREVTDRFHAVKCQLDNHTFCPVTSWGPRSQNFSSS